MPLSVASHLRRTRWFSLPQYHCLSSRRINAGLFLWYQDAALPLHKIRIVASTYSYRLPVRCLVTTSTSQSNHDRDTDPRKYLDGVPESLLIHWKGEHIEGYSKQFRHAELTSALSAVSGRPCLLQFSDALCGTTEHSNLHATKLQQYKESMQYVTVVPPHDTNLSRRIWKQATERCSLVRDLYEVILVTNDPNSLVTSQTAFADLRVGGEHEAASWCLRALGRLPHRNRKHGGRAKSGSLEQAAVQWLNPLLEQLQGPVDLRQPDYMIVIIDGLLFPRGEEDTSHFRRTGLAITRKLASGPKQIVTIEPSRRICVSNTPMCPIAAVLLCNIAGVRKDHGILDPYAGSCSTLLAAAMIATDCRTVGIDISLTLDHDKIRKDFTTRSLSVPQELIKGDFTNFAVRDKARQAIGGGPFDHIVTDPPYGIREIIGGKKKTGTTPTIRREDATSASSSTPLLDLIHAIREDRDRGKPLLKRGGRLVLFAPVPRDETIQNVLPTYEEVTNAGLRLELCVEQPLHSKLSRWLVSFVCEN